MKKNHLSQALSVLITASLVAGAAMAQEQEATERVSPVVPAQSVQQAVEKAVLSHPEIGARFHDFMSSLEGENVAKGGWRPKIVAQGWTGHEWRSNIPNAPSYDWTRSGWQVQLRQLIFDGMATSNSIRQLGYEKLSRYYDLRSSSESIASEVMDAYLDVQRYREMQRLAQENFRLHTATLKQLRERQESGVGRGVDMEQASGRVALAQANVMTESNNLNDVSQRYRRLVGEYPAQYLEPVADADMMRLPQKGVTVDFANALRGNTSILSKQALVEAAEAGEKVAKAGHSPKLEFIASTGRDRDQLGALVSRTNVQDTRVELLLTYNLYSGGSDSARIRQTVAQNYAARDVRDYTCRNVQQELSIAWNNIERLRQQMPFLQEHVLSTARVRTAYMQQFQIGQRTLLDLLNTENELFEARGALTHAQYDMKKWQYKWLAHASQILPALDVAQPHQNSEPSESLVLPNNILAACQTPVPDTSNLAPEPMM